MKKAVGFMVGFLLFGSAVFPVQAAFTALYVFGDGLSTTTNNTVGPAYLYDGLRYSNGRVWVEVLAQRQGLFYDTNKNWSYFYNSSTTLVANVSSFQAPPDASNALFVVWVNCADLWFPAMYSAANMSTWTSAINQSQTNHYKAVTNLYAKGVRTLIMPTAVDLGTIPAFNNSPNANFIHLRCIDYNVAFSNTLNRIRASCPDLTLYSPDFFTLLTNLLAHPSSYGVTNALANKGQGNKSIDAVNDPALGNKALNGPGTNYIFWDPENPSAKVHMWMANLTQQLISPAQISSVTPVNGSNRLDLVNVPIGQNGSVIGSLSLMRPAWITNAAVISTNATESVYVPATWPQWFYKLSFPYSWTWP